MSDDEVEIITPYVLRLQEENQNLETERLVIDCSNQQLKQQLGTYARNLDEKNKQLKQMVEDNKLKEKLLNDWKKVTDESFKKLHNQSQGILIRYKGEQAKISELENQLRKQIEVNQIQQKNENNRIQQKEQTHNKEIQNIQEQAQNQINGLQDKIEKAQKSIKDLETLNKSQQLEINKQLQLFSKLQENLEEKNKSHQNLQTENRALNQQNSDFLLEIQQLKMQCHGLNESLKEDSKKTFENYQQQIKSMQQEMQLKIQDLTFKLDNQQQFSVSELSNLRQVINQMQITIDDQNKTVEDLKGKIIQSEEAYSIQSTQLNTTNQKLIEIEKLKKNLEEEAFKLKTHIQGLDKKIKKYNQQKDETLVQNQLLLQQVDQKDKDVNSLNVQITILTTKLTEKQQENEKQQVLLEEKEKQISSLTFQKEDASRRCSKMEDEMKSQQMKSQIVIKQAPNSNGSQVRQSRLQTALTNNELLQLQYDKLQERYKQEVESMTKIADEFTKSDPCQTMRIMIELIEKKLEELNLNDNEDIELKKIQRDSLVFEFNKSLNNLKQYLEKVDIILKFEFLNNSVKKQNPK